MSPYSLWTVSHDEFWDAQSGNGDCGHSVKAIPCQEADLLSAGQFPKKLINTPLHFLGRVFRRIGIRLCLSHKRGRTNQNYRNPDLADSHR